MAFIDSVAQGLASGLGVGIANWLFIKRLEALEKKMVKKLNRKRL